MTHVDPSIIEHGTHECPADGCSIRVSDDHLLCRGHWFTVPRELRDRVWQTWRAWNRGGGSGADYIEARDAAIAAASAGGAQEALL